MIDDHFFSDPRIRTQYVPFLNAYSNRILPGTDFVASGDKCFEVYREALEATSRINRHLNDVAFQNIALGENYFRLLNLDYGAPGCVLVKVNAECPARVVAAAGTNQ